jgi:hypothetical protein
MLVLSRQKFCEDAVILQVFEGADIRVTVSYQPPAEVIAFVVSYGFEDACYYCLEWSAKRGFGYAKVCNRSPDILETFEPDRPFARDRISFLVNPEHQLLFEVIQNRIAEYERFKRVTHSDDF